MPGFLDGLTNVLGTIGTGFATPRLQQQLGPDWRGQLEQREFERQRARTQAEQQDQAAQLAQENAIAEQLALVDAGAPQGNDQGPLPAPDIGSLIPREIEDARRRQRISGQVRGRSAQLRSSLEAQRGQNRLTERALQGDQANEQIDRRGEIAAEMARLQEELRRGRPISATDQARLAQWEIAEAGRNARAAASGGRSGRGMLMPVMNEQGEIQGFYNNRTGEAVQAPPEIMGQRRTPVPAGENEKRSLLSGMVDDADHLEQLANRGRDSIGVVAGRTAAARRGPLSLVLGENSPEINDMFHISDNLGDQLLRARSGAQINEQEYARLRPLVPNPRDPEGKFFADLRRFRYEVNRLLTTRQSSRPGVPAPAQGTGRPGAGGVTPRTPATSRYQITVE